jgi:hypothetical protein
MGTTAFMKCRPVKTDSNAPAPFCESARDIRILIEPSGVLPTISNLGPVRTAGTALLD